VQERSLYGTNRVGEPILLAIMPSEQPVCKRCSAHASCPEKPDMTAKGGNVGCFASCFSLVHSSI